MVGHRNVLDRKPINGRVEQPERFLRHRRRDLGAEARGKRILMDNEAAPGSTYGFAYRFAIPWRHRPEIEEVYAAGEPILRYEPAPPMLGTTGEIEALSLWAGQSVALAKQPQPAAEIIAELISRL